MRVVLLMPSFPRLSETFVVQRFVRLLRRGVDSHVVCRHINNDIRYFPELETAEVEARVHVRPRARRWGRNGIGRRGRSEDPTLVTLRPDLVHFEFGHQAIGDIELCKALGFRVLVSFQGADINYLGLNDPACYQRVWDNADAVHFVSEDLRRRARSRGCPDSLVQEVIPPVMNLDLFARSGHRPAPGDRPLRILSVGRLHWKKGHEYGLHAVRLLSDRGARSEYRVVGDGAYLSTLRLAARQLRVEHLVRFVGSLHPPDVVREMERADVLLHPAVSEGFGCAVVEAQAVGLPVVAFDADGLNESVLHDVTGFVVPRRDPERLAEKLIELAEDPALLVQMSGAARDRARTEFDPDRTVRRFERLYRRVCAADPREALV